MARQFGVYEATLPTIKSLSIVPSDFLIGGIIGQFQRKYATAFAVHNPAEKQQIFGIDDYSSAYYGSDAVKGFFDNASGVDATLWIKSHVGYTGSAIDAVVASSILQNTDTAPATLLNIQAAYQNTVEYGLNGNFTGYTIENGYRFNTTASVAGSSGDAFITCTSVSDIKIGDTINIQGSTPIYKIVTGVDQGTKKVSFTGTLGQSVSQTNTVQVIGFKIHTWRKDTVTGLVSEVDVNLGRQWLSINPIVTDYYVANVFAQSSWLTITRATTTPSSPEKDFPATNATVVYLASGADGTAPTTAAHWDLDLHSFDNIPVRFIANCETTNITIQQAIETYCQSRTDNPKVIYNVPSNQTKAQLVVTGNNYQRSDDVLGLIATPFLQIQDPYSTNPAAIRTIPNVGHIMGVEIYTIGTKGIHYIPQKDTPIKGIVGLDNAAILTLNDIDRTDLGQAGINLIQSVTGYGFILRNGRTPSTSLEFRYFNAIVMREYIGQSIVETLQPNENEPNSYNRILAGADAIRQFFYSLWFKGSTGNVPQGETFGQYIKTDGTPTQPTDHFIVQADAINNPITSIQQGYRNYDNWFTFPAPTESIKVGVGIILANQQ